MKKALAPVLLAAATAASAASPANVYCVVRLFEKKGEGIETPIASLPIQRQLTPRQLSGEDLSARPARFSERTADYVAQLRQGMPIADNGLIGSSIEAEPAAMMDGKISLRVKAVYTRLVSAAGRGGREIPGLERIEFSRDVVAQAGDSVRIESPQSTYGTRLVVYVSVSRPK